MKKFLLLFGLLAAGVLTASAQYSQYQSRTLVSGSLTNTQTATAGRYVTNTTTVVTTNANSVITTNVSTSVATYLTVDTNWCDLALSPAGGVCPVDIQIYAANSSAILTNIIMTFGVTVDKVRRSSTTILVTNTPSAFSNSVSKATIAAATFGNAAAFQLVSINNTGAVTNNVKVDYGYWKVR